MDPAVQRFLEAHAPHFNATPGGRVKCELNGHDFPARVEPLEAFVKGKKYGKLLDEAKVDRELQRLEPFIVPSRNFPRRLYCALTDELVNRSLREVRQHMKGRKFTNAKARFEQDKLELHEEMAMEELLKHAGLGSDEEDDASDGPGVSGGADVGDEQLEGEPESMVVEPDSAVQAHKRQNGTAVKGKAAKPHGGGGGGNGGSAQQAAKQGKQALAKAGTAAAAKRPRQGRAKRVRVD